MRPDGVHDRGDLGFRKAALPQDLRRLTAGVSHVVPLGQCVWVFRPMADEDPEVMQPRRSMEDVVIVGLTVGKPSRKLVKPGLVAELVRRLRLGADVIGDGLSVSGLTHGLRPVAASTART